MPNTLALYHGTTHDFAEIDVRKGKPFKDDEHSLLYLESAEYIFDMLQAEQCGDWERWKEE